MHTGGGALAAARAAQLAGDGDQRQSDPGSERVEKTVRLLDSDEMREAIRKESVTVTVGTPPQDIKLMPMSPAAVVEAWPLVIKLAKPLLTLALMSQAGKPLDIPTMIASFGEDISYLPHLIYLCIKRGNDPTIINEQWVNENLDMLPDLAVIAPIIVKQNQFAKFFAGKLTPPPAQSSNGGGSKQSDEATTAQSNRTEESSAVSPSSATDTGGTSE